MATARADLCLYIYSATVFHNFSFFLLNVWMILLDVVCAIIKRVFFGSSGCFFHLDQNWFFFSFFTRQKQQIRCHIKYSTVLLFINWLSSSGLYSLANDYIHVPLIDTNIFKLFGSRLRHRSFSFSLVFVFPIVLRSANRFFISHRWRVRFIPSNIHVGRISNWVESYN